MINIPYRRFYRQESDLLDEAIRSVEMFSSRLKRQYRKSREVPKQVIQMEIWARGFVDSLNELALSRHLSRQYRQGIRAEFVEEMGEKETEQYFLYTYYFKNTFIRLFSVLDKLGTFMNQLFDLKTEKVKQRFSYFTVLRQMHDSKKHEYLAKRLSELKQNAQEPLNRLRKKRNLEVHAMNTELSDDLAAASSSFVEQSRVEPLDDHLRDLEEGYQLVCLSLAEVFRYSARSIADKSGYVN